MDQKPGKLFVWDRKEALVLLLLAGVVALFSFTFGLHLGKRVHAPQASQSANGEGAESGLIETREDQAPSRSELQGLEQETRAENEDLLDESLRDEVAKSGIRLEAPRQVELPTQKKSAVPAHLPLTLQIGSFPTREEAERILASLKVHGIESDLVEVEVPAVGKRYRVLSGRYARKEEAEKAGKEFQKKGWIESYLVTRAPEGKH